jgi:hypothetical protein
MFEERVEIISEWTTKSTGEFYTNQDVVDGEARWRVRWLLD